jgi:AcrR family transcriptional regulator
MAAMRGTSLEICGLRERKKQRTREALIQAAFDLFGRKGFEATTIDEIADAVEVSSRTFFRYFASKEDVVLTLQEDQFTAFYAALAARPPDEPLLTALRQATVGVVRDFEQGRAGTSAGRFSCVQDLLRHSPSVLARSLEQCSARTDEMSQRIAERMGVDPRTDPRPTLVAAVAGTALQVAVGAWRDTEPDTSAADLVERAFTLLEEGLNYPAPAVSR